MNIINTSLDGVYLIEPDIFEDQRGFFIKTFHAEIFKEKKLSCDFQESFYSISKKNVLRGMHFQVPPYEHAKLVYVTSGGILDVVLDIRKKSATYGKFIAVNLSAKNRKYIYIPKGCAHGFLSLEDGSIVIYLQTTVYSQKHDTGIRWDSFGMDWGINNPIVSERDKTFPNFMDFKSPFA
jgi:dTDP-4-dehydrorhamnose 3,5-epimerase